MSDLSGGVMLLLKSFDKVLDNAKDNKHGYLRTEKEINKIVEHILFTDNNIEKAIIDTCLESEKGNKVYTIQVKDFEFLNKVREECVRTL